MGRFVFKLPDVGEGTAEAELVGWHVKVGDVVSEDQIVADVMTDKATVEITSPVAGTVVALHGEAGKASRSGMRELFTSTGTTGSSIARAASRGRSAPASTTSLIRATAVAGSFAICSAMAIALSRAASSSTTSETSPARSASSCIASSTSRVW